MAEPASRGLPAGWLNPARKPTPPPPARGNTTIEDALMALPLKPSPEQAERCLANLATWGALDLAEMLGIASRQPRARSDRRGTRYETNRKD